jgi:hypothetical protein
MKERRRIEILLLALMTMLWGRVPGKGTGQRHSDCDRNQQQTQPVFNWPWVGAILKVME